MRRALTASAIAALVAATGCGGGSGDLLAIDVTGGPANREQRIVVQDNGQASCNGREQSDIGSDALIEAREIERELKDPAENADAFMGERRRGATYVARTKDGVVRWREGARALPEVLPRTQLFALQQSRKLC